MIKHLHGPAELLTAGDDTNFEKFLSDGTILSSIYTDCDNPLELFLSDKVFTGLAISEKPERQDAVLQIAVSIVENGDLRSASHFLSREAADVLRNVLNDWLDK